jgi:hypothetical protein
MLHSAAFCTLYMENHYMGIGANTERNRHLTCQNKRCLPRRTGVTAWLFALIALLLLGATSQAAIKYSLDGQNNPTNGVWTSGNLSGWGELDFVPCRVDMTGGPATNLVITINFPRFVGTVGGIQDLYYWSGTTNVVFVSQPTLTVSTGTTWTYSMTVTITNSAQADIYFYARLAAGSHAVGGSSLALGGTPSSMGNLQIAKPNAGNGQPDLGVIKTGPTLANAASFVSYSLSYTNSTNNAAVGVQLSDTLPTGCSFVSCSVPCSTNGNIVVADLGIVNKGAVGVVAFEIFVPGTVANGTKITNSVSIATSDDDTNPANNTSSWVTTITNTCVSATIGAQPQSTSACTGSATTFSIGANGTAPLAYQWFKNGSAISGATLSAYTIGSASTNDVASYSVFVTNLCGSVSSSSATLSLYMTTTATGPFATNVCPGSTATLSTTASGTGPFSYAWLKNGANMTGQTNNSITLTNVTSSDTATYSVVIVGNCNSLTNSAMFTVNTPASSTGLTSITNNCSGTLAAFTEAVSGTGPFTYVWKKNGALLSGQTTSALVIAATALTDSGTYTVEVSGLCNSITNSATLNVSTGTFGTAMTSLTNCPGTPASFSTTPSGAGPFSYVWRKNGTAIPSATQNSYSIASVAAGDAGTYSVAITGNCNTITNTATLTVNVPVSGGSFGAQTVCTGQNATFMTTPAGSGPFTYVWRKDGVVQSSALNSLTISSAATGDAGTYTVEVNGPCNSVTNSATLTVNSPTVASVPTSTTVCPGQSASFSTTASGTGPFTYVWKKNGTVQGSTTSSLSIASAASGDAGTYTVEVTGSCNSVTNSATLTVNTPTTASALTSATNCPGENVTFATVASGTGPFSYVWKKDGVVQGSTSNTLVIASLASSDAGSYTVEVTGNCNIVTNSATLTVNTPTTASALTDSTRCEEQPVTFTITASGTGPFAYVWKKNGIALGSTSNSLTIASAALADAGTYSVEVTGNCNSVTNSAVLTVNALTTSTSLNNLTNCVGQSATFATVSSGTGPFTYIWKKDGVVQSSTSNSLTIVSPTAADAGTYTVEIGGACNYVTNSATLTINTPTTASTVASSILCPGNSATFTTVAAGTGPFAYVWKKDGVVQSSTTDTLTIASITSADAGTYTVEVTGNCNSVTNSATLSVNTSTSATALNDVTTCVGQGASFTTTASGTGPFTYVWKKDGVVQSSTSNSLTIPSAATADAGVYTVEVSGNCNKVTNSATLTVNDLTSASSLTSVVRCVGKPATFATTPSGTGPFTYVWKKDGVVLNSTSNTLTIDSVTTGDAGNYSVEVGGACNVVTNSATLTVNELTTASALTDVVTCGQSATFTTIASGTGPFTYVWKKNGVVQSSTTNSLTVPSVTSADAGTYTVEVSGTCNSVTNSATLTVNADTSATALNDLVRCPGQSATFSTVVSGSGPFTYVWKKDGVVQSSTSSALTIDPVSSSDAGTYTVEVNGACNSVTNNATLTVNTPTTASALSSQVVCPNNSATFTTVASGTGPFVYVWKKDGIVLTSATNEMTVASATASDAGTYSVEITGACNTVTNIATLTVNEPTTASSLTDSIVCPSKPAAFATTVSGTGPFSYVWKKNGVVLDGATTNSFSIAEVTAADAGTYTVEVTGTCNIVTNTATLTVNENVAASALTDVVVCENQLASFSTMATGTGPLSYVWKKDGTVLSTETSSSLSIASAQLGDAGIYTVEITGLCTSATNSATLTVNKLTASSDLTSLVVCPGKDATFTTVASGAGPFTYVWTKDGQPLPGETADHLTINNVTAANGGTYSVRVSGNCNFVDKAATLTVNENTSATEITNLVVCPGYSASFTTVATGTGPFSFVWKKDGVVMDGETTNAITINSVAAANAGTYTVEVSGVCTAVTNSATLTVNENVAASALTDAIVCQGQPTGFSTVATGTGPFSYVWKKDGSVLSGQTDSAINIASADVADTGVYTVEVSGTCTSVTNSATLTVNRTTTSSDLTSLVVCPGKSATFTTIPSGTGPFTYAWSKDGQPLAGESNDHLTIDSVTAANGGTYSVHVTGICNSVDKDATLTVNENTTATALTDLILCPGQDATFTTTVAGTGPFAYVWKKDGIAIDGQTTNSISIPSVTAANGGTYTVEVTGACTSVTNSAVLTINEVVSATPLTDVVVCQGQPASFTTTPSGTGPFTFVWKMNGNVLSGQTDNSISIATSDLSDAGTYTVEVKGICTIVTNSATLTVNSTTTASALTSLVVCPSTNVIFATVPSGTGPFTFAWSKDGQPLMGETNSSLTLNNVAAANSGTYTVHVTGTCNSVDQSATLTVNENASASSLTSLVLCPGGTATFTTIASGSGPLNFVWKKDGVVQSSTSNSLTIASVANPDSGTYTVEVTGVCSSVTNSATLTVTTNTAATALNDLVRCPGESATFSTVATGNGPFSYVWRKDGNVLSSETNSALTIASVSAASAGVYSVEVGGICTSATNSATLIVNTNVSATALTSVVVCAGASTSFSTVASGTGPFTYTWKKNGQVIASETNASLFVNSISSNDAGTYSVEVSGACAIVTNSATLTLSTLAATPLISTTNCVGQPLTFATTATGVGPFTYQWKKNGGIIGGATKSAYTIASAQTSDAGTYTVEVGSMCLSVTNSATLTINQNLTASALVSITRCPGQSATFATAVSGTGPFAYVWKRNGQVLSGQTTSAVTINPLTNSDNGTYTVEVTTFCNSITNSATLTVKTNVTTSPLGNLIVCNGQPATFIASASGTAPFAYRWKKNGTVISGVTSSAYTIASVTATNAGTYSVEVTGSCNVSTNTGTLMVNGPTTISGIVHQNICLGDTATFTALVTGAGPFTYQWRFNGNIVAGQTTDTLVLTNLPVSTNVVTVEVNGQCSGATNSANLTVWDNNSPANGVVHVNNSAAIRINDNQPASPYPSTLFVRCVPNQLKKITVTLNTISHSYPKDIDVMVVSPFGRALILMSHCGGDTPASGSTITFDDDAPDTLSPDSFLGGGTFKVSSYWTTPMFPTPAPTPNAIKLRDLLTDNPGGSWSLYVLDDNPIDDGYIADGWTLNLFYADFNVMQFVNSQYLADGSFQTTLIGTEGFTHVIQSSTDLVNWTTIATSTLPGGTYTVTVPMAANGPKQFYRAYRTE